MYEGNETQGKSGKKSPGAIFRVSPVGVRRRDAPNKQDWTIARQIFSDFVQVQIAFTKM